MTSGLTPQGISYAKRRDPLDPVGLGQAMAESIEAPLEAARIELVTDVEDRGIQLYQEHMFDGYQRWPEFPEIRGSSAGTVNLSTHYVHDRYRRLGSMVLADLLVVFSSTPGGITGDIEFKLPFPAFSQDTVVGHGFVRNPKSGENQDFVWVELWGTNEYVRLVSTESGGLYTSAYFDFYVGVFGEIQLHLRYESTEESS